MKDESNIKLMKPGRRRIVHQEDGTVTDADSTSEFLRDKRIQKMIESDAVVKHHEESEYTESEGNR